MSDFETITVEARDQAAPICIVIVAYNRAASLARLLRSVVTARYDGDEVDLVVSIDGSDRSEEIVAECRAIRWTAGRYLIRRHTVNQGLRTHVLSCGDISRDHRAIVMLEDDLVVSPQFYRFAKQATAFYSTDERIAGISLYAPRHNEMAVLPFEPEIGASSVYALQSAQSWGQIWSKEMWHEFREWCDRSPAQLEAAPDMPPAIYRWPQTSWKKFAMKFLVESGRTWIYPYLSLSTNFSEVGTHNPSPTALYQAMLDGAPRDYRFEPLDQLVRYDIFFERCAEQMGGLRASSEEPPIVDLYGTRPRAQGPCRLLTRRLLSRSPLRTFGLVMRPQEANLAHGHEGDMIAEYRILPGECIELSSLPLRDVVPFHSNLEWRRAFRFGLRGLQHAIVRRLPG